MRNWRTRKHGSTAQIGRKFKTSDRSNWISGRTLDEFDVSHMYDGKQLHGNVRVKERVWQGGDWDERPFTKDELVTKRLHKAGLYIDDEVPSELLPSIGLHELIESYLVQCRGVSPQRAHRLANEEETKVFGSKCDAGTDFARAIFKGHGRISGRDLERLKYKYPAYFAKRGKSGDSGMEKKLERLEKQMRELYRKIDEEYERKWNIERWRRGEIS